MIDIVIVSEPSYLTSKSWRRLRMFTYIATWSPKTQCPIRLGRTLWHYFDISRISCDFSLPSSFFACTSSVDHLQRLRCGRNAEWLDDRHKFLCYWTEWSTRNQSATRQSSLCACWESTRQDETAFSFATQQISMVYSVTFSQHTTSGRV